MWHLDTYCVFRSEDGAKHFEIRQKVDSSERIYQTLRYVGCSWTLKPSFSDLFDSDVPCDAFESFVRNAGMEIRAAFGIGAPVLRIECMDTSPRRVRFSAVRKRGRDSEEWETAGFIAVNRKRWRDVLPDVPCSTEECSRYLEENFEDDVNRDVNRDFFEIFFVDEKSGEQFACGEYRCPDDAKRAALALFPECTVEVPDPCDVEADTCEAWEAFCEYFWTAEGYEELTAAGWTTSARLRRTGTFREDPAT